MYKDSGGDGESGDGDPNGDCLARFHGLALPWSRGFGDSVWHSNVMELHRIDVWRCPLSPLGRVPFTVPRRCAERPLQLAPYPRLDVQRALQRDHHLLLVHNIIRPPSLQQKWKSCRAGNRWGHNVHLCRVGSELPDGPSH
ncbi:ATPase E1-E2 type family protein [Actinidia rufa]|uniref:ATPase E1-E2 type family protein n=1 Tax=Actinidia rufa TaxID=165716 RepID=A0A7J0H6L9_9ERIC|nr:ATPase E1-E2 type family protein [Actinidia rufa]